MSKAVDEVNVGFAGRGFISAFILSIVTSPSLLAERRVALTFDDLPGVSYPASDRCNAEKMLRWNRRLVDKLAAARVPALGLVVDHNLCERERSRLADIYDVWLDGGFELGNHTASHRDLNRTDLSSYQQDVILGEKTLQPLLQKRGKRLTWFRYPYLRSGTELEKKRTFESFLAKRGYRIAPVTIDNEEYVYASAYARALEHGDSALQQRIVDDYLRHMEEMFAFYEKLASETLGYEPPQILLLHMNALNADHLEHLLAMIRRRGYRVISIEEAMRDRAYAIRDTYVGVRGRSWIQRWRVTKGLDVREEPDAPAWVANVLKPATR